MKHSKEEIMKFRKDLYAALLNIKDGSKPFLTPKEAQHLMLGYEDDETLDYDMDGNTPESLAELLTL